MQGPRFRFMFNVLCHLLLHSSFEVCCSLEAMEFQTCSLGLVFLKERANESKYTNGPYGYVSNMIYKGLLSSIAGIIGSVTTTMYKL